MSYSATWHLGVQFFQSLGGELILVDIDISGAIAVILPTSMRALMILGVAVLLQTVAKAEDEKQPQYRAGEIVVSAAAATEATRKEFSLAKANEYLERGALGWTRGRKCVTCHTNGTYMVTRPALTPQLGQPNKEIRQFFVDQLQKLKILERDKFKKGTRAAQVIFIAAGLAEWDAHASRKLSPETDEALRFLFMLQEDYGTWSSLDCWPPFESSSYQEATVAAMAAATAPGWLANIEDEKLLARVEKLKDYLRETKPPHDYARLLLLWTATRMMGLLDEAERKQIVATIWKHQRDDGGWSIRTFAKPEEWGRGNRAEKLRDEPDFENSASDGHMTGLAVIVLREAGIAADDERVQAGVKWLLANQRESGRWWTRSLNTDRFHFITYSGTAYPLLALAKCGKLPAKVETSSR